MSNQAPMSEADFEANNRLLRRELRELLRVADAIARSGVGHDGAQVMALGSLTAAQELVRGVLAETRAQPPRALNAVRLARHLWELETELHYVAENPQVRLQQMVANDAIRSLELHRSYPKAQRPTMQPEKEQLFQRYEHEAKPRDKAARERRLAGEKVPADDWGSTPDRLTICEELGRTREHHMYYGWASLYSHPSVIGLDSRLRMDGDLVVVAGNGDQTRVLASQALSLARVFACRLILRAARLVGADAHEANLVAYMAKGQLKETGIYSSP